MIIVFGSLNIDLVMPVGRFPNPKETVLCTSDYLSRPGGKGANQAVAAARAGAKVAFVGKVGDDAFGRRCVNNLKNYGIWASGVGISERPTGCATIAVGPGGTSFVISAPGANIDATSDQAPDEVFTPENIVLTQMEVAPSETFSVLKRAKALGTTTILDLSPAAPIPTDALQAVDYLIMNELEALQLAQYMNIHDTYARELALKFADIGKLTCIITREEKGAVAARDGVLYTVAAMPVDVIDATGAGDVFCGVFAAMLEEGATWLSAMHHASIGASMSCTGLGAQASTPELEEIKANLSKIAPPYIVE